MGLPMGQKTCQICHKFGPDFAERISLKPLDGFTPFKVSWTCLDLKLCNAIVICPFATYGLVHGPKTCQIGQHLGQTLRDPYLWNRWVGQSSMELSRPVVVQHNGCLTIALYFQGQMLKMLYIRNGRADWHGTKGMRVDRMLDPQCDIELWPQPLHWPLIFKVKFWKSRNSGMRRPDNMERKGCDFELWPHPWPWPLIFKVKFWKSRNSGMRCPDNMERKGCESTECWTHVMAFNFDLTHDIDFEFSTSNFEKSYIPGTGHPTKGIWIDRVLYLFCDLELWPWPCIFKIKFWKCCISGMGGPIDMESKGCESIWC